jgi:lipopolysaccharide transport system permease protein
VTNIQNEITTTIAPPEGEQLPQTIESTEQWVIIEPPKSWLSLNLRELWSYRDLLFTLIGRDIKVRYKQTVLGASWVVLQPLLAAAIFAVVFGQVAKLPSDGVPYFLFSYVGLAGWSLFNNTMSRASGCLVGNAQLVSKVYFPRLLLPLSAVGSVVVDFLVSAVVMIVLMILYGVTPGWAILLVPAWLSLILGIALGISLWAAALTVRYRDVGYIVSVFTQMLMYASPVAYATSAVTGRLKYFYFLNPLASLLEGFRFSVLGTNVPTLGAVAWSVGIAGLVLFVGSMVFRHMERQFADVI